MHSNQKQQHTKFNKKMKTNAIQRSC